MSADIHVAYTIYSATPGAGDWFIDCRLSGLAVGANTFTWKATVNGVTVNGAAQVLTKDTAETTLQAIIPIHCAASEAVVVTVLSSSSSDTAVTASSTLAYNSTDPTTLLDLTNGVESSVTVRQALRAMAAVLAGILSGGGSGTEVVKGIGQASGGTTRVTFHDDSSGNRTAVDLSLT